MKTRARLPAAPRVGRAKAAIGGLLALLVLALPAAPAVAGDIRATVRDRDGKPVADAVVVVVPSGGAAGAGTPPGVAEEDQRNKEFVPYVLPVQAGTRVLFPNNDNIRHHVYSFSPAKTFELPLYSGTPTSPVLFDKPGVVILGCNIHDWMVGYIYVSESPHFAKTGADGKVTLGGLPGGDYTLRVWHPRLEGSEQATAQPLAVPSTGAVDAATTIGLTPDFRARRAPTPGRGGY
ncbi:methylamine utilization protein [Aromatoleum toluolicum]|uniref:Methylamine utilization protein n=1 Tax=Aromatoleum toluolicum TaxID=90060 RepID=A0ABX1NNG4_9RHOO|nr:methylamine utilization protein [Aromatoleum toluolicum]NMG00816.1 methylamine utilization protein [Aromatoleum toluolicum]